MDPFSQEGFQKFCCPEAALPSQYQYVADMLTTLMSLFNDIQQGEMEEILEFRFHFDGLIMDMARSKIILPPILLIMLFVHALHSCYSAILDQFCYWYNVLETATINSVVDNVQFYDGFRLIGLDAKASGVPAPKVAAATAANVDQQLAGYCMGHSL